MKKLVVLEVKQGVRPSTSYLPSEMERVAKYVTDDGRKFDTKPEAREHERTQLLHKALYAALGILNPGRELSPREFISALIGNEQKVREVFDNKALKARKARKIGVPRVASLKSLASIPSDVHARATVAA